MPEQYLNVEEVESALEVAARTYPEFIERIELPNKTWKQRACHAVKIARGTEQGRVGVYFSGGIHAREWVPPDALISFIERLAASYKNSKGITIGATRFTADQAKKIVDTLDVFIFPQVNPDGRYYTMPKPNGSNDRTDVMWRKNASPPQPNERRCEGVDINRNFDFLWDYERYFAPAALRVLMNSTHPCDDVYIGPRSLSEPETQNVAWIMDQYPQIRFYVDVHSYSDLILVGWGDDDEQTTDPDMHFRNPEYDGKRGITKESLRPDAANYAEYVLEKDQVLAKNLAKRVQKAMFRVRKRAYTVEQSVTLYPTAGTSTDYAAGRFRINQNNSKVYAFCIECGSGAPDEGFQPTLENRQLIIEEIIAGLLEFCIGVIALDSDS